LHWSEKYETFRESDLSIFPSFNIPVPDFYKLLLDFQIWAIIRCNILIAQLLLLEYYSLTDPTTGISSTPGHISTPNTIIHAKDCMLSSHYPSPPHSIYSLSALSLSTSCTYRLWLPRLTRQPLFAIHLPHLSYGQEVHVSDFQGLDRERKSSKEEAGGGGLSRRYARKKSRMEGSHRKF